MVLWTATVAMCCVGSNISAGKETDARVYTRNADCQTLHGNYNMYIYTFIHLCIPNRRPQAFFPSSDVCVLTCVLPLCGADEVFCLPFMLIQVYSVPVSFQNAGCSFTACPTYFSCLGQ